MPTARKAKKKTGRLIPVKSPALVPRALTVPSEMTMVLRYCTVLNSAGTLQNYVFVANGLYDPDLTGIGHQPKGFDQMMALYERYDCHSSTINLHIVNDGSHPMGCVVLPKKDTSTASDISGPIEAPFSVHGVTGSATANALLRLTNHVNIGRFTGRSKVDLAYTGDSLNNPLQAVYWLVVLESLGGLDAHSAKWLATIDYTVRFFNRKPLGAS